MKPKFIFEFVFSFPETIGMARPNQMGFQTSSSPIMDGIIEFHNHIMFFVILAVILVTYLLYIAITNFSCSDSAAVNAHGTYWPFTYYSSKFKLPSFLPAVSSRFSHASILEIVWTLFPTIILMCIAVPSFALLYAMDINVSAETNLQVIGHQWYWTYHFHGSFIEDGMRIALPPCWDNYNFYSDPLRSWDKMIDINNIELTIWTRLLQPQYSITLPSQEYVRLLVTSTDVIHSWAIPSLGIKIDAIPGRINQGFFFTRNEGVFFGQCSEICGINHGFMPISLVVDNVWTFKSELVGFIV